MEAVKAELPYYPGVEMDARDRGGNHRKVTFYRGGRSRFLIIPRSPSDWRAPKNAVAQLRKTMEELGAERVAEPVEVARIANAAPPAKARRGKRRPVATVSLRDKLFVVHIGAASKLIGRFRTEDNRPAAHWSFELRPSVDLAAPPLIVLKRSEIEDGKKHPGVAAGFAVKGGSWRITVARNQIPALARLPDFKGTGVRLYADEGDRLVFELPAGTIPTGFRKREGEAPLPSEAFKPKPEPVEAKPVQPDAPALVDIGDRPLVLQMPKQAVSVEAAIKVLNAAKRRLGSNLRFTIQEDGYLSAVHRIGY